MENGKKYYHIYNRGVEKRNVFECGFDYERFLLSLVVLNNKNSHGGVYNFNRQNNIKTSDVLNGHPMFTSLDDRLVDILSFCLIPNHYHLILKEKIENGVSEFMRKLGNAYTKYFNFKYKRSGFLFQGKYKKVEINSDEQLKYLFGYVNGNYEIHSGLRTSQVLGEPPMSYKYSSYFELVGKEKIVTDKNYFNNEFETKKDFDEFLREVIKESSSIKSDKKKYIIE